MPRTQLIIVLGCALDSAGRPSAPLLRRIEAAARAWHEGLAPLVVASGGRRWFGRAEASVMAAELLERGVPKSALRVELCSLTTEENALYCHQFARESWDLLRAPDRLSVVLVSCDWHMRRARGHFERQGFDCIPYPAQSPRSARSGLRWALERTRVAIDTALAKSELNL